MTTEPKADDLLKLSELARRGVACEKTLRGWIAAGILPAAKTPGGHYRIRRADAERLMHGGAR